MSKVRLADMPEDKPDIDLLWHNATETVSRLLGAIKSHNLDASRLAVEEVNAELNELYIVINHG